MSTNIKYFFIGNLTTRQAFFDENINATQDTERDIKQIFERICSNKDKKFEERTKVPNKNGNYLFTCLQPNRFYMVLADNKFSETTVFELIKEVNNSSAFDTIGENDQIQQHGKSYIKIVIDNYNKKKNNLNEINNDINEIKLEMKNNVRSLIQSKEQASELEKRAEDIKDGADLFAQNANKVKKLACWQNFKLWIIIILIIIGIIIVIVVPIVVSKSGSSGSSSTNSSENSTTGNLL